MIVLDIETGGMVVGRNPLLSIGALEFENPSNSFYGECGGVREGQVIDPEALKINGFSEKKILSNKKSAGELIKEFYLWAKQITDRTIGGHNISFDISFLEHEFGLAGVEWVFGHRYIDLHSIMFSHFLQKRIKPVADGLSALSLTRIMEYLGVLVVRGKHNALEDAKLTAECLSRIIYRKGLILEYGGFKVPEI